MNYFLFGAIVVMAPAMVHAQVVITEIMYDLAEGSDSGREWIEVYNVGASTVSLTNFVVLENGKKHAIVATTSGDSLLPGAYAVIADNPAQFKGDYPSYAGILFDSAFSLNNTGETIGIGNADGATIDAVSYTNARPVRGEASNGAGGNGTGDSLQRNPSSQQFEAGIPSPGEGIPASGLLKSPPKETKSSKKKAAQKMGDATPLPGRQAGPPILGEKVTREPEASVAAAAASGSTHYLWWLAPLLTSLLGSAGIVATRHFKKEEWEIVEEVEETG